MSVFAHNRLHYSPFHVIVSNFVKHFDWEIFFSCFIFVLTHKKARMCHYLTRAWRKSAVTCLRSARSLRPKRSSTSVAWESRVRRARSRPRPRPRPYHHCRLPRQQSQPRRLTARRNLLSSRLNSTLGAPIPGNRFIWHQMWTNPSKMYI